ncbi:FCS-Like Zinc finger 5-like [Hibiscus syriacus]|uniref:FCS-Like Zinc finger 5-like n=1 Tax=Hibiscus syriacus TaxID=106335 RepID=UPI001923D960|nr:FCS-Like Zinc finger 5-like [Hibiscus syriacus]
MLLGKRTRQSIKKTTSMTEITVVDASNLEEVVDQHPIVSDPPPPHREFHDGNSRSDQRFSAMVSPKNRSSERSAFTNHVVNGTTSASPFLQSCWLCNSRLAPGRNIYMYRGDTAFCSLECREKQMKEDERKEKNAIAAASKREDRHAHASSTTSKNSKAEPVVAA